MYRWGPTLSEGRIVYGRSWFWWVPKAIERPITGVWNIVVCFILGHRWLCRNSPEELPVCADCCRFVRNFDEKEVINEY